MSLDSMISAEKGNQKLCKTLKHCFNNERSLMKQKFQNQNQTQNQTFIILDLLWKQTTCTIMYNPKMIYFRLSALKSSTAF